MRRVAVKVNIVVFSLFIVSNVKEKLQCSRNKVMKFRWVMLLACFQIYWTNSGILKKKKKKYSFLFWFS